jgi:hypothetical protein
VSDTTALTTQVTAMIEKAWGRPITELEKESIRRPAEDPLLHAAMHIRSFLVVSDNAVGVHKDRLHALTRPAHVPIFYELERITTTASDLRVAQAEAFAALRAVDAVIEARNAAAPTADMPATRLVKAAVARSAHTPPGTAPSPGPSPSAATTGPVAATTRPHR